MSELKGKAVESLQKKDFDSLCQFANQLCRDEGDYATAIDLLGKGLAIDPFNENMRSTRGRKYIGTFNYCASIADMSLASRINPENWEIWYYGGVAAFLAEEYEQCKYFHNHARALMLENGIEAIPATVDWYWMACKKLGQDSESERILNDYVTEDMASEDGDDNGNVRVC